MIYGERFDEFLARQAAQTGTPFVPFNLETDYQRYVDGKPRVAGVLSFLAARDINLPMGDFGESAEQESVHGLLSGKISIF